MRSKQYDNFHPVLCIERSDLLTDLNNIMKMYQNTDLAFKSFLLFYEVNFTAVQNKNLNSFAQQSDNQLTFAVRVSEAMFPWGQVDMLLCTVLL